jgi:hypothetical protein
MTPTEKDAARYRWLRTGDNAWRVFRFTVTDPELCDGDELEAAIDRAMRYDACNDAKNVHNPPNVRRISKGTPDHLGG